MLVNWAPSHQWPRWRTSFPVIFRFQCTLQCFHSNMTNNKYIFSSVQFFRDAACMTVEINLKIENQPIGDAQIRLMSRYLSAVIAYRCLNLWTLHYDDVIMTMLASQITSLTVVYSIVYSGVNQRKHQSSASLAFVWEIHRGPVNFPHKWPVTRKMFPFDDVIMKSIIQPLITK